jgi:general secretion pathway protein H
MQISATQMPEPATVCSVSRSTRGFTVIELLVTLGIVAALTSTVLILMPVTPTQLSDDVVRFSTRLIAARNNAVMQSRPVAVSVTPNGYRFSSFRYGQWRPMTDSAFRPMTWANGATGRVATARANRMVFDSTGTGTQGIVFTLEKDAARLRVTIDPDGTVRTGS